MSFFYAPDKFSFKDLLAAAFQVPFFYVVWRALASGQCLEVLRVLITPECIILGGYFAQEAVPAIRSAWQGQSQAQTYYPQNYNASQGNLNGSVANEPLAPADIPAAKTNY